ncbi:hypothetical protein K469DRAFT_720417 [Zopfia rhizophila CBS 207.26]|uniref:Uncharacterized protein n=1 Tax=Zopfia rhizophila CBS 207.26 TaxID=1314779 RepID=A0A6A6EJ57_9PEZI|nr:hypothetical protein K469DRAFT_720417 [Zopfia rhizophila CBS 207.26]
MHATSSAVKYSKEKKGGESILSNFFWFFLYERASCIRAWQFGGIENSDSVIMRAY